MTERGPIFLAGIDRSGIGLVGEILDRHPRIAISRRTRYWSLYFGRYGDLADRGNAERLVDALLQYTRIRALRPDRERLLREMYRCGASASYSELFSLIQRHNLERIGKHRWGDKTLNSERHAAIILGAFPTASMIHVLRDPRDRYASQALHREASRGRVGAGSALWLWSVRRARRNRTAYPDRYHVVRYEDLVGRPRDVVEDLCRFLGEAFDPAMLDVPPMGGRNATDPVEGMPSPAFTTTSIGRFRRDLATPDIAFVQLVAGRRMRSLGYEPVPTPMSKRERVRFLASHVPLNIGRMIAWWLNALYRDRTHRSPPERRTVQVT